MGDQEFALFGLIFIILGVPAVVLLCIWALDGSGSSDEGYPDPVQIKRDWIRAEEGLRAVQEFEGDPDGWDEYWENRDSTWIG